MSRVVDYPVLEFISRKKYQLITIAVVHEGQ